MELTEFAQYGVVGISLALIGALVIIVKTVLRIVGNHINHNTNAWIKNTEALQALKDVINSLKL
ncbi:MAG: hypothetical protein HY376_02290 [Candidatus Blackburnbacteria bacterium]|nr:hypothetical protein [Candidatus Blackburnbacteria bacterium]